MTVVSLIYHDVVSPGAAHASGRRGEGPDSYKLTRDGFARHLEILSGVPAASRAVWPDLPAAAPAFVLTFDDGGVSAAETTAPMLERHGWRGHFFIVTDEIGAPGHVSAEQIRALDAAGHVIGSHSATHPDRFAGLSAAEQRGEWSRSTEVLAGILGRPVRVASVPGGYYDDRVAQCAEAAGIRALFTSEPRTRSWRRGECRVFGRFSVRKSTSDRQIAGLVHDRGLHRQRQRALWELKKAVKKLGGERYTAARRAWMSGAKEEER